MVGTAESSNHLSQIWPLPGHRSRMMNSYCLVSHTTDWVFHMWSFFRKCSNFWILNSTKALWDSWQNQKTDWPWHVWLWVISQIKSPNIMAYYDFESGSISRNLWTVTEQSGQWSEIYRSELVLIEWNDYVWTLIAKCVKPLHNKWNLNNEAK